MPEKREIVEQTAQDFEKLPNDMKMYVLGYMARCMEERGTEKSPPNRRAERSRYEHNTECPARI